MTDEIYLRACVGPEGLYTAGDIDTAIPWPDILKHAPLDALCREMRERVGKEIRGFEVRP